MAFNFPSTPSVGDIHAEAGVNYRWSGYAWNVVSQDDVYGPVFVSDTPPPNPVCGDLWWEGDRGILYIYYKDIDSSQWVQATSGAALNSSNYLPLSGGVMSGQIDFNAQVAKNAADPVAAQDLTTKAYVDKHSPSIVSATPPTVDSNGNAVKDGDLWYDSTGGRTYMWYDDGNSQQWVDIAPPGPFDTAFAATQLVQTLTAAADDTAAAAAGVAVGQMYLVPGGATFNDVRIRLV